MSKSTIGHGFTPKEIENGKRTLYRAVAWRYNNPQAWALIVSHALDLASKKQPIAAQALIESVRKKALVDKFGDETKTDNSFASVFARWLIIEHPETAPYIERRRSVFDVLIGGCNG